MGKWYLGELTKSELAEKSQKAQPFPNNQPSDNSSQEGTDTGTGIVEYVDLDAKKYEQLIRLSRGRLSELSATFMEEKRKIEFNNAALFRRVREYYQRRDKLVLVIKYRRSFLDVLLTHGEEEAKTVSDEYKEAQAEADQEYEDARKKTEKVTALSDEEATQLQDLWKRLVKVFHPDRYRSEPEKQAIYEKLISVINDARETGNISLLVEISRNPDAYIDKQGWASINLDVQSKSINLKKLYEAIEVEIVERIEALTELRGSPDYRVAMYCNGNSERLEEVAKQQIEALNVEISDLRQEAERLKNEIEELTENQALG
jgi:DNA polymerase-3 subunit epsilon